MKQLKLYDLQQRTADGVKLYVTNDKGEEITARFGHLDGMYSYCWVEGDPTKVIHLSAVTPVQIYKDGYKVVD